jgi:MFS family permease
VNDEQGAGQPEGVGESLTERVEESPQRTKVGSKRPTYTFWRLIFVTAASQAGASYAQQGLAVLAEPLRLAVGVSLTAMGALVSATAVGAILGMMVWGMVLDRAGPRATAIVGTIAAAASLVVAGRFAHGPYAALVAVLLVYGLAAPSLPLVGMTLISAGVSGDRQATALGWRQAATPVGSLIAAGTLPLLLEVWPFTAVFDLLSGIILAVGWTITRHSPRFSLSVPLAQKGDSLAWRYLWSAATIAVLIGGGQYVLLTYTIPFATRIVGVNVAQGTAALTAVLGLGLVGRAVSGWISDAYFGLVGTLMAYCSLAASGFGMAAVSGRSLAGWEGIAVLIACGIGAVGWNSLLYAWTGRLVPQARRGTAFGMIGSLSFVSVALWSTAFGWIAEHASYRVAWAALAGAFVLAAGLAWRSAHTTPESNR